MNKIYFCAICVVSLVFFSFSAQAKDWYEGGTLHSASVQDWLSATPENILATTGDIVAATTDSDQLRSQSSSTLKNASIEAAKCMVTATEGVEEVYHQKASQFVIICMAQLKEQYPWMLTKKN